MYFISDSAMLKHFCPWESYHIEVPKRLEVIQDTIQVEQLRPRPATKEEVEMVHTSHYISQIASTVNMDVKELEEFSSNFEDIYVNNETFDASLLAAGCVMELVDAVTQTGSPGFAAVRPPGHHAFPDKGCGFCIFNNVALAAKHALKRGRASRVLIVDWDVHAGQGTQECISDDERIRLVSIHRFERGKFWPNLPQSAVKNEFQNTINVPLNDIGMTDSDFLGIFQLVVHPVINDFKPDLIIVSCGFDAALGDPEGEMRLTPAGYATLTQQLLTRGIPLAMILEGGYFLDSIAADFEWVVKALLGYAIPCVNVEPLNPALRPVINKIFNVFGTTYPTLRLLQTIGQRLTPRDDAEKNDVEEYEGTRDFPIPFPTRGLYSERCADVTSRLKKELQSIIASYSKESQYKFVRYDCTDVDLPFAYMNSADTISLEISAEAKGIVHHLISQTINPLLPSIAYEPSISASDLSRVVELIRNISSISGLPSLHITQL
ncbi:hypothetical protein Q1695_012908 [Nippostrongylus brasiliensis]|nr:hypothetical protein Q1695_012908 [Nippostrongylus brasiliensis]